jgi:hypothetical protein
MSAKSVAPGTQQKRFVAYLHSRVQAAGNQDREAPLKSYCTGLLLPGERKSVEPMAARLCQAPIEAWVVDDTGLVKKETHSVGVTRQYCRQVGKQENCRVLVSLSISTAAASLPIAWRLYLPEVWSEDKERRKATGVPEEIKLRPDAAPERRLASLCEPCCSVPTARPSPRLTLTTMRRIFRHSRRLGAFPAQRQSFGYFLHVPKGAAGVCHCFCECVSYGPRGNRRGAQSLVIVVAVLAKLSDPGPARA